MNLSEYINKQQKMLTLLDTCMVVCKNLHLTTQVVSIQSDYIQLQNEKFNLVVVGEFSRGKSTFINAMMGQKILPSSKSPTTAVISKISYGKEKSFTVYRKSGETRQISEEEFLEIKAQSEGNLLSIDKLKAMVKASENLNDIAYIEIQYPLDFCRNHVEVIDTPGVNDLNTDRVEITHGYMTNADAAILVLSASQLLTQSELNFLKEQILGNQIRDIFIVINGKDIACKNSDDEQRLLEYAKTHIAEIIPESVPIYLVSSKQALDYRRKEAGEKLSKKTMLKMPETIDVTGFPIFENALAEFLDSERGRAKIQKYALRLDQYLKVLEKHIKLQNTNVEHSADEIRAKLFMMKPKLSKAKATSRHIIENMRSRLLSKESEILNEGEMTFTKMRQAALDSLIGYNEKMSSGEVEHLINSATAPIQKAFLKEIQVSQKQIFTSEVQKAWIDLQKVWQDLSSENLNVSEISISHEVSGLNIVNVSNVNTWSPLLGGAGLGALVAGSTALGIGLLIAAVFLLGSATEDKKEKVKEEIRKKFDASHDDFLNRIKTQYNHQCNDVCDHLAKTIEIRIDDMENQIAAIIKIKETNDGDAKKIQANLQKYSLAIQNIKSDLAEMMR